MRRGLSRLAAACAVVGAVVVGATGSTRAASLIAVTRFDDPAGVGSCPSDCSLRQAVAAASSGDTVELPVGTYTLSRGQLVVSKTLVFLATNARTTILTRADGASAARLVEVSSTGNLTATGLTFTGGDTTADDGEPNAGVGGGIWVDSGGTLTLANVTVKGNTAAQSGGGIDTDGALAIAGSTISGNTVTGGNGIGGGIDDFGSSLAVVNSTISDNSAAEDGGGVLAASAATLASDTIAGNTSASGAGVFDYGDATIEAVDTIVAKNTGGDCNATLQSLGHNLSSDSSCGFGGTGDLESTDPLLGSLANYGGPTDTLLPAKGSPAIDAGDDNACPGTDQRGTTRPQGAHCDIGAVEVTSGSNQPPTASFTTSANGLSVSFDASGSSDADGSIASYAWKFGDGATGTGVAPTHAYAKAGTYTVSLTVTDDKGATGSVSKSIQAQLPPPASIVVDETITAGDGGDVTPPAAVTDGEPIAVGDVVAVVPPVAIGDAEGVTVSDTVQVLPPVTVTDNETVTVGDGVLVLPPVSIGVTEPVGVTDGDGVSKKT